MRSYYKVLIIFSLFYVSLSRGATNAYAHPIDVGYANFQIKDQNTLEAKYQLTWAQIVILGEKNGSQAVKDFQSQSDGLSFMEHVDRILSENKNFLSDYLRQHIFIYTNIVPCPLNAFEIPSQNNMELLFGRGVRINAIYNCPQKISRLTIKNDILFDRFPLETHIISVNYLNKTSEKTVSVKNPDAEFDLTSGNIPENKSAPSPLLTSFMNRLIDNFTSAQKNSLFLSFVLVFILGLFHTLEPGHSKNILAALLVDNKITLKHGFIYTVVFTLTHLSDVIILGSIIIIASSFTDIYSRLPYLEKVSAWGILLTAVVLIYRNLKNIRHTSQDHHHENNKQVTSINFKKQLWLGFLTGLSPCLMGWSIFFVMVNSKVTWGIIPVILFFGLGIFCALLLLLGSSLFLKKKLQHRFTFVTAYLPLLSSLILLIFAVKSVL